MGGGKDAMVQRLSDKYVSELAEMAKQSNMVIVPDRPNDVSGVVATAMGLYGQIGSARNGAKTSEEMAEVLGKVAAGAGDVKRAPSAPAKSTDPLAGVR